MADHYLKSVELLEELDDVRSEIAAEYAKPRLYDECDTPRLAPGVRERLNTLHARERRILKLAEIHAALAQVQALHERALVR